PITASKAPATSEFAWHPGSQTRSGYEVGPRAVGGVLVLTHGRTVALSHQEGSYAQCQVWIGMITFGTRRRRIGNLPKKPQMSSANKNASTWRPSARRLPIALRIV